MLTAQEKKDSRFTSGGYTYYMTSNCKPKRVLSGHNMKEAITITISEYYDSAKERDRY